VCLIIGQLGLGGAEKQITLLASGLHRRGVETTVVVLRAGGPREQVLRDAGVPLINLGLPAPLRSWQHPFVAGQAVARLRRTLRRLRPDIVHAFLFHSYVLAAPAARLARVPVYIAGRRSLSDYKRRLAFATPVERVATAMTDLLIANADAVATEVVRTEGVSPAKIRVVYNGLPDDAFEPHPPDPLASPHPVLLCVANLRGYKGHRYLLDAAAELRGRGIECTLVLAGDGDQRQALRDQATRLRLDVRFLGARTDVPALLARTDLVVQPSLTEGMSNAVMEAMAAGRPVVATEVGGTGELLRGRGVLVPPADSTALAAGIESLLWDPYRAKELADAAREWSRRRLHVDTMVDQHLTIYADLLENRCAA
jgi:glycosyltransferase involved in cell wall biosynthesis